MTKVTRRDVLRTCAALPVVGGLLPSFLATARSTASTRHLPRKLGSGLQEDGADRSLILMTNEIKQAVSKALEFLASRQNQDGSFGAGPYSRNVGVCGLAGLAFLTAGSTPNRGKHGAHIERCLQFISSACGADGFITKEDYQSHGPMYGHGFATLFLAEVYGMTASQHVRDHLINAVQVIIDSQNEEGGWRYQPRRQDADLSVTVSQVMALRAARNAGVYVPSDTIDRCVEYVKRSQNPDGGFTYMLDGGESDFPRSAAAIVALYSAGIYEGKEIDEGLAYLEKFMPNERSQILPTHFFYGHYYAIQAMWQTGGERWQRWYPAISQLLLKRQQGDGSWQDSIGPEYGTAMATIVLQMPNSYLPIFQR